MVARNRKCIPPSQYIIKGGGTPRQQTGMGMEDNLVLIFYGLWPEEYFVKFSQHPPPQHHPVWHIWKTWSTFVLNISFLPPPPKLKKNV